MKTYGRCLKSSYTGRELNLPDEYENACRLCLTKDNVNVNIHNDDIVPIASKLKYCIALEVSEDDGLPRAVCTDCISQLDQAYTFKMRCHATDVKLRQLIKIPSFTHSFAFCSGLVETTLLEDSENDKSRDACTINMEDSCLMYVNETCNSNKGVTDKNHNVPLVKTENDCGSNVDKVEDDADNEENILFHIDSENSQFTPININRVDTAEKDLCTEEDSEENKMNEENPLYLEKDGEVSENSRESTTVNFFNKKRKLLSSPPLCSESSSDEVKSTDSGQDEIVLMSKKLLHSKTIYRCSSCTTKYLSYKELFNHIRINHGETLKMCNICRKSFLSKSTLERHMRTHTGERPFQCLECGKRFSQKEILNRHNFTHLEEKPFKCKHCNFTCSYSEKMTNHIISFHTDPENGNYPKFQCTKCNKAFLHASGLSRHQAIHTGTTFQCSLCQKIFSDKSSVKRHQSKVHSNELECH